MRIVHYAVGEKLMHRRNYEKKETYQLNTEFEMRELGGEFVAVKRGEQEADPSRVVFLNERCIYLWGCLEDGHTLSEMVKMLMNKFEIDDEEAEADVGEFIGKLKNSGMLE